jgi:hypothetical protein
VESENPRFVDRVLRLLERSEYRRADRLSDKQAIYRLRHEAYMRAGTVEARPSGMFHDPLDETDNAWLIGLYIDGELAGALRLHVSASPKALMPAMMSFSDVVEPLLDSGRVIIDATRFVAKLDFSQRYSEIPYLTLRPTFLAEEFFGADYIAVACLVEHQAFYRRMFGCVPWSQPRQYPNFNRMMAFLGYDCRARRESTDARYPFYRSTERERERLFSRSSNASGDVRQAIGREIESEASGQPARPAIPGPPASRAFHFARAGGQGWSDHASARRPAYAQSMDSEDLSPRHASQSS